MVHHREQCALQRSGCDHQRQHCDSHGKKTDPPRKQERGGDINQRGQQQHERRATPDVQDPANAQTTPQLRSYRDTQKIQRKDRRECLWQTTGRESRKPHPQHLLHQTRRAHKESNTPRHPFQAHAAALRTRHHPPSATIALMAAASQVTCRKSMI